MKFLLTLAASAAIAAAATAADPVTAWQAHDARIKSLEDRVAALEARPARPPAAVAAARPPAPALNAAGVPADAPPAGTTWEKAGTLDSAAPWLLVPAAAPTVTAEYDPWARFRDFAPAASPCANGRCPTPRR